MSPGPNVAHRAWHRRGHGVLRQIDEASQIKDGDTNIAHARTSDVNLRKSVSGQDGVIIAKEGNRGLAHTGLKIETIILDSTRTYSLMIDPGCEHSLVPREHVTKLDEIVKDAAGEKSKFERGLVKVLRSNVYGNGRVIWRLEFVDKEHGFNCGGLKHDEICRKLNIASFHELICAGQSSQADSTPALSLNNETLSSEEPVEPNKQRRVAASFDKELAIHNERPDCVTGTGKVIIAKDHSVPRMNSMYYAPDQDKVSISNGATAAVECEHVASEPRSCKIFLPDSQLPILLSLVQKSLEAFRPGDSKPEIGYLALKLGIWLCKTQRRAIELRCDDINGCDTQTLRFRDFCDLRLGGSMRAGQCAGDGVSMRSV
ncbi:hypothetical protein HBI23_255330 [Parastagonospora nodorum]|nr:hypothetical protein HBI23_255330 [Parastagonospora nodorum]KAH6132839.1 hypothetical protein HBI68_254430 [Parastagonospora nodorum]KAH6383356.1 hypothetical protein HBI60_257310 [Parastagonospora nodorum]